MIDRAAVTHAGSAGRRRRRGTCTTNGLMSLDPAKTQLRQTLASIESEVALLPASHRLHAYAADLASQLALGPEPLLRECPNCRYEAMREATLCSNCWKKLTPL